MNTKSVSKKKEKWSESCNVTASEDAGRSVDGLQNLETQGACTLHKGP